MRPGNPRVRHSHRGFLRHGHGQPELRFRPGMRPSLRTQKSNWRYSARYSNSVSRLAREEEEDCLHEPGARRRYQRSTPTPSTTERVVSSKLSPVLGYLICVLCEHEPARPAFSRRRGQRTLPALSSASTDVRQITAGNSGARWALSYPCH